MAQTKAHQKRAHINYALSGCHLVRYRQGIWWTGHVCVHFRKTCVRFSDARLRNVCLSFAASAIQSCGSG